VIEFRNITKTFPGQSHPALIDISFRVERGQLLALLGSSGSGKSTLLKTVNLLIHDFQGEILIQGKNNRDYALGTLRRECGFVFQNHGLFPHLTVGENIALPMQIAGKSPEQIARQVDKLLVDVELPPQEYARRYPDQLSGGQAQRVGVARALANDPDILLMDEPFSALDGIVRSELQQFVRQLLKQGSKTIIFVTHDLMEALEIADQIAVLHEGRLEQIAPPTEMLGNPGTPFVESLFEKPRRLLRI